LIGRKATVAAVFAEIARLHVAAKICAVRFRDIAFTADNAALKFFRDPLADLVQQYPASLVRHAKVAGSWNSKQPAFPSAVCRGLTSWKHQGMM
jgi:hypothetical protein